MALFYSSTSAVGVNHGVFAIERPPPTVISPTGTNVAAIVGQFSWGPMQSLYSTANRADFINTFAPLGMSRLSSGYLQVLNSAYPVLKVVRVLGVGAVAATIIIQKTGPVTMVTLTLKSPGTQGNNVVAVTTAADDGNANHFNLTLSVSNAQGTTAEIFRNLNYSGVGTNSPLTFSNAIFLASVVVNSAGAPLLQQFTASGGTDGAAIAATDYVGTQGATDKGIALLEGDNTIRHFFCDDMGVSLRTAVNTGVSSHATYMLDRIGYICGPSGNTATQAQTDVATYQNTNIVYTDPWVFVFDDTTGAKQLIPSNFLAASLGSIVSPSTAFSWRDNTIRKFLVGVVGLESNRGSQKAQNTAVGISTLIPFITGGFCFEAAKVTIAPATPSKANWTRTNIGIYIAASVTSSLASNVDAPNVPLFQQDIINAIDAFLQGMVKNVSINPAGAPYIMGYNLLPTSTSNLPTDAAQGNFTVAANIQTGSSMERIFFSVAYGESVVITAQS